MFTFRTFILKVLLFSCLSILYIHGAELPGDWEGYITLPSASLSIEAHFNDSSGIISGTMDIPMQKAYQLKIVNIELNEDIVKFELEGIPGNPSFKGNINIKSIEGLFIQSGQEFPFVLNMAEADDESEKAMIEEIKAFVDSMLIEWDVPGASVAVVKDNKVLFAEGFGFSDIESGNKVNAGTLFQIGSATKAFTSADVALLVDRGVVNWDDKVIEHLPDFQLADKYASEHATISDIASHQSGLPRHDFTLFNLDNTREGLFSKLKYLPMRNELREGFHYQNHMYITLGIMIERLSGLSWEEYTMNNILLPLGMNNTNFFIKDMIATDNYALPYRELKEKNTQIPFFDSPAMGPAGSINSCADDMAKWIQFQIGNGTWHDNEIISHSSMNTMHSPFSIYSKNLLYPELGYTLYGLGWFLNSYRGVNLVYHGGNIDGFTSLVTLVPDSQWAIAVMVNKDGSTLPTIINYYILDELMNRDIVDWSGRYIKRIEEAEKMMAEKQDNDDKKIKAKSTHVLKDYTGTYNNPGYGDFVIDIEKGKLIGNYNGLRIPLKHSVYDIFDAILEDYGSAVLQSRFDMDDKGNIELFTITLESSSDPIEFHKVIDNKLSSIEYMKAFEGVYAYEGFSIEIDLRGNELIMIAQGQNPVTLIPYKDKEYSIKDLNGYYVRFNDKKDVLTLIQPDGTYTFKREN